ncbi:MAG TPA: hypothetical protein VF447_06795 [Terriglobales bacterium]
MGTRYGRRAGDGTTEYYDSKAALVAAANRESAARMANFFALIGLVAGGAIAYYFLHHTSALAWPKAVRALILVASVAVGAFLLRVMGRYLLMLFALLFLIGTLMSVGKWIWHIA